MAGKLATSLAGPSSHPDRHFRAWDPEALNTPQSPKGLVEIHTLELVATFADVSQRPAARALPFGEDAPEAETALPSEWSGPKR